MTKIQRIIFQNCPLCGGTNSFQERTADCSKHPAYSPDLPAQMIWLRCTTCNHSYTDGYFDVDGLELIVSKENPNQSFSPTLAEQWRPLCARMVGKVSEIRDSFSGQWLDVGIGNGALLITAQEFGYQVTGIDIRKSCIDAVKPYIDDVRFIDFSQLQEPDTFNVISMADVLEHIPFPDEVLKHAYNLLTKDGILFISLPNFNTPLWKILDSKNANPYWTELEHYHNFSRERLYDLLQENGFEACHYGISERYRVCMEVTARKV